MPQQDVDVVRRAYEAFAEGDMQVVSDLLAGTEWHEAEGMPYGGTYHGAEEIFANVFGPITADVAEFSVRPDEILDAGDRIVALGRYRGKAANGPVDVPFAHVWEVDDGRISRFVQHTDTRVFGEAVGK